MTSSSNFNSYNNAPPTEIQMSRVNQEPHSNEMLAVLQSIDRNVQEGVALLKDFKR